MKADVRTDYNRSAFCYNTRYRSIQQEKYLKMLDTPLKGRILDVGCGTGLFSEFLHKDVVGIDLSFAMLENASCTVVQADMDFLPFRDAVFDAAVSFTSLQNLPSFERVFIEIRRVLKKDHPFICTVLRKKYNSSLRECMEYSFCIAERRECGEDVGFICY